VKEEVRISRPAVNRRPYRLKEGIDKGKGGRGGDLGVLVLDERKRLGRIRIICLRRGGEAYIGIICGFGKACRGQTRRGDGFLKGGASSAGDNQKADRSEIASAGYGRAREGNGTTSANPGGYIKGRRKGIRSERLRDQTRECPGAYEKSRSDIVLLVQKAPIELRKKGLQTAGE